MDLHPRTILQRGDDLLLRGLWDELVLLGEMQHQRAADFASLAQVLIDPPAIIGNGRIRIRARGREEGQQPSEAEPDHAHFAGRTLQPARRGDGGGDVRHALTTSNFG